MQLAVLLGECQGRAGYGTALYHAGTEPNEAPERMRFPCVRWAIRGHTPAMAATQTS